MFALQPGETIAWQGKPRYQKLGLPFVVLFTVFVFLIAYFAQPSSFWRDFNGLVFLFGLLNLLYVYIFTKYAGVSYYVTDNRVVRSQTLRAFSNFQEISLSSIVSIKTRRLRGIGTILFQSRDASTLTFANLREDPMKVRQLTESAMLAGRQSVLQEFESRSS